MGRDDTQPKIKKIVTTTRFEEDSEPHNSVSSDEPIKWGKIKTWSDRLGSLYGIVLIILAVAGVGYMTSATMEQKVDRAAFQTAMEKVAEKLKSQDDKIDVIDTRINELDKKMSVDLALIRYWVEEMGKKNGVKPPPSTLAPHSP